MQLRDGVLAVRNNIGEIVPQFWSNDFIVDALNVSARAMTSEAQSLQTFATFNTKQLPSGVWAQEYILPGDIDQIIGAAYLSGVVFPLTPVPRESVQLGSYVGGIPMYFYEKQYTQELTHQTPTGIEMEAINPNDLAGSRCTIGFYPVPQQVLPVYIWYQQWHPQMKNPTDLCLIPDKFKQGWIAYAVARCKEKEAAMQEAQYWDGVHMRVKQEFVDWRITNGQEITPPTFSNRPLPPYFLRGASSVIVVAQNPGLVNP
jgi:hypothetical protein